MHTHINRHTHAHTHENEDADADRDSNMRRDRDRAMLRGRGRPRCAPTHTTCSNTHTTCALTPHALSQFTEAFKRAGRGDKGVQTGRKRRQRGTRHGRLFCCSNATEGSRDEENAGARTHRCVCTHTLTTRQGSRMGYFEDSLPLDLRCAHTNTKPLALSLTHTQTHAHAHRRRWIG